MLEYLPITQSLYIYISSLSLMYSTVPCPPPSFSPINEGVARIVVRRLTECRARECVMCVASLERKESDAGKRNGYT